MKYMLDKLTGQLHWNVRYLLQYHKKFSILLKFVFLMDRYRVRLGKSTLSPKGTQKHFQAGGSTEHKTDITGSFV
jgi:hypothetical protein